MGKISSQSSTAATITWRRWPNPCRIKRTRMACRPWRLKVVEQLRLVVLEARTGAMVRQILTSSMSLPMKVRVSVGRFRIRVARFRADCRRVLAEGRSSMEMVVGRCLNRLQKRSDLCNIKLVKQPCPTRTALFLCPLVEEEAYLQKLPAMLHPGVTIVVCPLRSLIRDQIVAFNLKLAVPATFLNSQQTTSQATAVMRELRKSRSSCKLLYVTRERIAGNMPFMEILKSLHYKGQLAGFVIDEAQCVSQWGHDFWPDYRGLGCLKQNFPDVPIMVLTATAAQHVRQDTLDALRIPIALVLETSFDRPNEVINENKNSLKQLGQLIKDRFHETCGIVYCFSKNECLDVASYLNKNCKVKAAHYHAGLAA